LVANPERTITQIFEAIKTAESGENKNEPPPVVVESAAIDNEFEIPLNQAAAV
jgi:hypothetical protein